MLSWVKDHRRKVTAFVLLAIPLWMMMTTDSAEIGEPSSPPTEVAGGVVGASQAGMHTAIGTVAGLWTRMTGSGELAQENKELRREVDRLREEKTRLIGVLQENARLREMVQFQEAHPEFELAPARVVGRDISPYFRVLKVQLESTQELEPRMPVVSAEGVVGQIHRVYKGYADVVIIADPRSRIDAVSQRNRALGIVEGLGNEADYRARVAYLSEGDELSVGDTMVTSGMGGVYPRELRIGTVVSVESDVRGLFQDVIVEPAVDFSRLEEVFVITDVD